MRGTPHTHRSQRITFRLMAASMCFVLVGSISLLAWIDHQSRVQSDRLFLETARANAQFIRTGAPLSDKTAQSLSEVLQMDVRFARPSENQLQPSSDSDSAVMPILGNRQRVTVPVRDGYHLVLERDRPPRHPLTAAPYIIPLGVFCGLSLAFAAILSRTIVLPLKTLADSVPLLYSTPLQPIPVQNRFDEIGDLARALHDGRVRWQEERRAREHAERLASLGQMATGLAHEINNPVAAIRLHAQLIEETEAAESAKTIVAATERIESLVNQWLFLARPEAPAQSQYDLVELIQETLATTAPALRHAKIRVELEIAPARVTADRQRILQALENLVINAIHAMPQGGVLRIKTAPHDGHIALTVADSGPGFTPSALVHATELFYSEKEGGMGIGLNVVSEIVRASSGTLRLTNTNTGAAVILTFPVQKS
jgi:signal transduction histidine kinase